MNTKREYFSSQIGFILACVGSAVGLGNLWLFPLRLGQYGGAAFLIPYLLFVYLIGTTGLMGEYGLGRFAGKGAMGAYDKVLRKNGYLFGRTMGTFPVLISFGIVIFYSVVSSWVIRYFFESLFPSFLEKPDFGTHFGGLFEPGPAFFWLAICLGIISLILMRGISAGIEKLNKIMMPGLFLLLLILIFRSLSLNGAGEGLKFLFNPDWSQLLNPITWAMALGQAFFSVSLTGAGMVVYGSYLSRSTDIPYSALLTVNMDTLAAIAAALVIIPAVFAFGLDPASGPPLLFVTMPEVFKNMPGGFIFAILFFLGVLFAAISSLISLMEVVVEGMMDQFNTNRKFSVLLIASLTFVLAIPLSVNLDRLSIIIDFFSIYLLPIGAVLAGLVFFVINPIGQTREEINQGSRYPVGKWWEPLARYVFIGISLLIVVLQILFQIG
jgi:neurotransmitter:Na+ symporter, NSS family